MRLHRAELFTVEMPLVSPFATSFAVQTHRQLTLLRVETDAGVGWGECVAMADPLYSSEYLAAAGQVISDFLLPRLRGKDLSASAVSHLLGPVKGHRMAKATVEMALLDAELRGASMSLSDYLGGVHDRVPSGVSVGIMDSVEELLAAVGGYLEEGYQRIKLKIQPGWELEPVRAVRREFGDIALQVDANAAFTTADVRLFQQMDEFGLLLVEQPLEDEDLTDHAFLAARISTPVCLDESVVSAKSAADAIALGACSVVNIKAGRVGGYLEARRVHDVCAAHGVPVWCGGMVETGIGRAANMALAALPNFRLIGDTSASDRFFTTDIITQPFVIEDGYVAVPRGPGLGVEVDEQALAAVTVARTEIALG
ncbi:o-succinylbenzoate synthase [Ornithinimicrobium pratense]|uniref:o-succinylbenzoate synthase n=1 Tax=Ornithinimicrobium pratense TaxID=2593973 RepID=A0A5J6V566_9MICO|nr:o-succinylbenzoate synthase [Ornithinimicrobium pratense]QFG68454.1 o-succinylbenzoate synthase [Ornithinimicrobium pratense]